jgi:hypothetical protein
MFCDGGVLEMVDVCKFAVAIRIRKLQDQFGCFTEKIANTCRNRGTVWNSFLLSTYRPRLHNANCSGHLSQREVVSLSLPSVVPQY